jgi:hypothetical protein
MRVQCLVLVAVVAVVVHVSLCSSVKEKKNKLQHRVATVLCTTNVLLHVIHLFKASLA